MTLELGEGLADAIEQGRASFERRAWEDAFGQLSEADASSALEPADLDRLARAAYLTGREAEGEATMARAHQELVGRRDTQGAARCAFWVGFRLIGKGEMARGGGWLARASTILDDGPLDCVERGYLLVPGGLMALAQGDAEGALAAFAQAAELAERFRDPDLAAICRVGRGQSLIVRGDRASGVALLDEAMVAVTSGEVGPIVAGILYCAVIEVCQDMYDFRRAQEWTAALSHWCASQPDLVPFRGQCLVYRAEIMQSHGSWADAMDEARQARDRLSQPPEPAVGMAFYRMGELHRLRGESSEAEGAYAEANQWGRSPQPGFALLRLAQGQVEASEAAIRHVVDEAQGPVDRSKLLPAFIEIVLTAGDTPAARTAADELSEIATDVDAPMLYAIATFADGAVLLAEGDPPAAIASLRRSWTIWQELEAPYDAARVRVLMARGCRELGDEDTAEMELGAAKRVFERLGATPDLERVEELSRRTSKANASGLTAREIEVLRLIATGRTNRAIADDLVISEKTVARHVSNIFAKLGLSTRAAATAFAYEQDLV